MAIFSRGARCGVEALAESVGAGPEFVGGPSPIGSDEADRNAFPLLRLKEVVNVAPVKVADVGEVGPARCHGIVRAWLAPPHRGWPAAPRVGRGELRGRCGGGVLPGTDEADVRPIEHVGDLDCRVIDGRVDDRVAVAAIQTAKKGE